MTALASLPPTLENVKQGFLPLSWAPSSAKRREVSASPVPCCPRSAAAPCPCFPTPPPSGADAPCAGVGARSCGWRRLHPRRGRSAGDRLFPGWSLPGRRTRRACVCRAPGVCVWAVPPHPQMTYLDHFLKFGSRRSCRLPVVLGRLPGDALLHRVSVGSPGPRVAASLGLPLLTYLGWPARTPSSVPLGVLVRMRVSHEVLSCCLLAGDHRVTESASSAPGMGSVTSAFWRAPESWKPVHGMDCRPSALLSPRTLGSSRDGQHCGAVPRQFLSPGREELQLRGVAGRCWARLANCFQGTQGHSSRRRSTRPVLPAPVPPNTAPRPCSFWLMQCSNL